MARQRKNELSETYKATDDHSTQHHGPKRYQGSREAVHDRKDVMELWANFDASVDVGIGGGSPV